MLLSAQTYSDYHPLFVDGKEWNFQIGLIELNTFDYQVDGDTVIDGAGLNFMLNLLQQMGYCIATGLNRNDKFVITIKKV